MIGLLNVVVCPGSAARRDAGESLSVPRLESQAARGSIEAKAPKRRPLHSSYRVMPGIRKPKLVFQRHHGLVVGAEGGDTLQSALGFGDVHDGAVAVDSVAGGGEVPFPTFARVLDLGLCQGLRGGREPRN